MSALRLLLFLSLMLPVSVHALPGTVDKCRRIKNKSLMHERMDRDLLARLKVCEKTAVPNGCKGLLAMILENGKKWRDVEIERSRLPNCEW